MKTTSGRRWVLAGVCVLATVRAHADYLDHHFDTAPFTNGATFMVSVSNWVASTSNVMVVNTKAYSASNSVYLPEGSAISNYVGQSSPGVVWTDLRLAPNLGAPPEDMSMTNGHSFLSYCGSNGLLRVWSGGAWLTCSNDVWGGAVAALTNGVFAEISIYQNFTNHTAAILLNDQVVLQDLPFSNAYTAYAYLKLINVSSDAWLDDAYVQTTYAAARLTNNLNGVYGRDAAELQAYGYVARTLYAGTGPGVPLFPTLQAALNAWRAHDSLYVYAGQYAEAVTVSNNVTFSGEAFTNSGSLTIGANAIVAFNQALTCSNLVVGANASVTFDSALNVAGLVSVAAGAAVAFNQSVLCGTLAVTGTVTLASGRALTVGSATVYGSVLAMGASTVTVTTALSVPVGGTGNLDFAGGRLVVPVAGVDMTGTFSITNTWGTQATAGLDFIENFELYADNTRLQDLGFRGWGAATSSVLVKATLGDGYSNGVLLPAGSQASNRIATAQTKVWTDVQVKPSLGRMPDVASTNSTAFLCYVASNGFLNVWSSNTWEACTHYVNGSNVTAMGTNAYARVTVFLNFSNHLAAVFVDGRLARERVGFPAGLTLNTYGSFATFNTDVEAGNIYLDNLRITAAFPTNLTADLDADAVNDAYEIQTYDSLLLWNGPRTLFLFR